MAIAAVNGIRNGADEKYRPVGVWSSIGCLNGIFRTTIQRSFCLSVEILTSSAGFSTRRFTESHANDRLKTVPPPKPWHVRMIAFGCNGFWDLPPNRRMYLRLFFVIGVIVTRASSPVCEDAIVAYRTCTINCPALRRECHRACDLVRICILESLDGRECKQWGFASRC